MNTHLQLKNRIKELRKSKGWSQTELAKAVGTTQNTISSLETGQYSPSAFLSGLISKTLGVTWEECFYYDDIISKEESIIKEDNILIDETGKTIPIQISKENEEYIIMLDNKEWVRTQSITHANKLFNMLKKDEAKPTIYY